MIHASIRQQGELGITALRAAVGVPRSGYYRHWRANEPRREEMALRDAIQRLSLADRKLGYRPVTVMLKREGWAVNHQAYRDLDDARSSIGRFLEEAYNRQRLHSALDYLAPEVFELAQRSEPPHAAVPIVRGYEAIVCV